ncbi:hypothetical protein Tco_0683777 [Tanacetum coccineum]
MNTTQAQQKALDDALVAPADRLEFGKCNMRLNTDIKPKEATLQVVLDALALTPFYQAFLITAEVPAIYMQEFWANVTIHKSSIRFTINKKKFSLNVEVFREILRIYPKIPGQPPLEHDILSFLRDLGHTIDIHYITDVSIDHLHQPRRAFATIINKCLSGKDTAYEKIRLSRAQILWADSDTSPKKKTAPATKGSRLKSSTKVAKSDKNKQPTTIPKTKGLVVLSEVALTEAEQMKLATKRSKIQFHSSHASGSGDGVDTQSKVPDEQQQKVSGTNEGAGVGPEVPDVPKYKSESEEESWTFSQGDDDDNNDDDESDMNDDSEETESDNEGDDFVHPKLSTYEVEDKDEEEKADDDEVSSDQKVSTPLDHEHTKDDENQEGDDYFKEGEHEEEDEEDLYGDVNINLERSDAEMTDAQANKDTKDAHVTLTAEPPVSHTLVNLPAFVAAETPSSETTTPQPPIPITQPLQQTPSSTITTTNPTTTLPEIPNFASVFWFDQRVSTLETKMSKFKQTNQFAKAVSSIPGIVDNYLASKMKEAVDVAVQLQSNKLR